MSVLRIAACCTLACALGAMEDLVIDDVRLGIGRSPGTYHIDGEGSAGTNAVRGALQYAHSFGELEPDGAWLIAIEGAATYARHKSDGDISAGKAILDLLPGYAAALPDEMRPMHVEVGPVLGLGWAVLRRAGDNHGAFAWEYGVRVAAFWTFANHAQLGLDVRYVQAQFSPTLDGERRKVDDEGIVAQLLLGWRF